MKPLKIALSLLLLSLSPLQQANAAVTSQSCYDNYASGTYYPPQIISTTCTTSATYSLGGTAALSYTNGNPFTTFNITGTMSQNESVTTETSGYSYGQLYTTMTFNVTDIGTYSMTRLDEMGWGITSVGAVTNSISSSAGFATDNTTKWAIWSNGVNATAYTLDGDSNGTAGLNVYENGVRAYVANIHLTAVPIPAAAWLLGSGLLGLIGVARRKAA